MCIPTYCYQLTKRNKTYVRIYSTCAHVRTYIFQVCIRLHCFVHTCMQFEDTDIFNCKSSPSWTLQWHEVRTINAYIIHTFPIHCPSPGLHMRLFMFKCPSINIPPTHHHRGGAVGSVIDNTSYRAKNKVSEFNWSAILSC